VNLLQDTSRLHLAVDVYREMNRLVGKEGEDDEFSDIDMVCVRYSIWGNVDYLHACVV